VAEDTGHDDQLDFSRCLFGADARLSAGELGSGRTYLLVPPTEPDPGEDLRALGDAIVHLKDRFDAPLGRWQQLGAYDTPTACEAERHDRLALVDDLAKQRPKESYVTSAAVIAAVRCIDVADPKLRKQR
jgi:hypothetical protein